MILYPGPLGQLPTKAYCSIRGPRAERRVKEITVAGRQRLRGFVVILVMLVEQPVRWPRKELRLVESVTAAEAPTRADSRISAEPTQL